MADDSIVTAPDVDRHARGLATLRRIGGEDGAAPIVALDDIAPDLIRYAIDFAFGEVLSSPALDARTRELCTVGALATMAHAASQLAWHMEAAVRVGARPHEVDEVRRIAASHAASPAEVSTDSAPQVIDAPQLMDRMTREIATVALLTAIATRPAVLKRHVRAALDAGASRAQVIAAIEQMAVYAGFPAALNAVAVAREVFEGR